MYRYTYTHIRFIAYVHAHAPAHAHAPTQNMHTHPHSHPIHLYVVSCLQALCVFAWVHLIDIYSNQILQQTILETNPKCDQVYFDFKALCNHFCVSVIIDVAAPVHSF
jgi:hypothetical protein